MEGIFGGVSCGCFGFGKSKGRILKLKVGTVALLTSESSPSAAVVALDLGIPTYSKHYGLETLKTAPNSIILYNKLNLELNYLKK